MFQILDTTATYIAISLKCKLNLTEFRYTVKLSREFLSTSTLRYIHIAQNPSSTFGIINSLINFIKQYLKYERVFVLQIFSLHQPVSNI